MTLQNPTFSENPVADGLEHLGHWLHIGEHDVIGGAMATVRRGLQVADELKEQFPTLAAESGDVVSDLLQCKTLGAAIALAVANEGVNLAADAGVLAALVTDGPAIIRLFADGGKLAKTADVDIQADMKILEGEKPDIAP
jgi:hypothetical protein